MATEIVVHANEDLQLQAVSGDQMISAHEQMRTWAGARIARLRADLNEEIEVRHIAAKNRWATKRHDRKIREMERRIDFFVKIDAALEAGYVIIPNFSMDVFAMRTDRTTPAPNTAQGGSWNVQMQSARVLPEGFGEYRNPHPMVQTDEEKTENGVERTSYAVGEWLDIEFPFALAKPMLMSRTAEALALKCFDEIGIVQDTGRSGGRGDPYIIGRILNPAKRPDISFFIGWFFDPSAL